MDAKENTDATNELAETFRNDLVQQVLQKVTEIDTFNILETERLNEEKATGDNEPEIISAGDTEPEIKPSGDIESEMKVAEDLKESETKSIENIEPEIKASECIETELIVAENLDSEIRSISIDKIDDPKLTM
jgi:hypothetical protein